MGVGQPCVRKFAGNFNFVFGFHVSHLSADEEILHRDKIVCVLVKFSVVTLFLIPESANL